MTFFTKLNFTSANEDGTSELKALCSTPPRRLLCLTGSGTRPLDMLLGDAREVVALDLNPVQNELLRLKIAAIHTLDSEDVFTYLGLSGNSKDRIRLHAHLSPALADASRAFWDQHMRLIAEGLWYAGLWEKVLRLGARANRLIRGRKIEQLFSASTLDEQAAIWRRHFDDWIWRASIRTLGRRWFWTHVIGEPGGAFLPPAGEIEERLRAALNHAAETFFFRDSDFASLILRGYHEVPRAIPLHLMPGRLEVVRERLDRIRIVEGGLHQLATLGLRDIDAFSLSDFGSYCTPQAYAACWRGIYGAAATGARVCEREFMNVLPPAQGVAWDNALSDRLTRADKSFIYRIRTGVIEKEPAV